MTRRCKAKSPDYAVSDEAAAYIAEALMELALQFEATHFAEIRRHYQSITPARTTIHANSICSKNLPAETASARLRSSDPGLSTS
jgi:hypothetical protein